MNHPVVKAAYESGEYTDKKGVVFKRGMDGWFSDGGTVEYEDGTTRHMTMLTYHHDMVNFIIKEAEPTP